MEKTNVAQLEPNMTDASTRPAEAHTPNTFVLKRAVPIPSLNLTVEEYAHPGTGAQHLT